MIRRNTWIILIIFALLLVVTIYWQRSQQDALDEEATPTAVAEQLFDVQETDIIGLHIWDEQGREIELSRDDEGSWVLLKPSAQETDSSSVDGAISQLLSLRPLSTLNPVPALDAMGLEPPVYRILIVLDDEQQIMVNIGKETATGSGYYVLTSNRPVSVVGKFGIDAVVGLLDNPPIMVTATPDGEVTTPQP